VFKGPRVPKRDLFTNARVEYNIFFCSTSPLKTPNRLESSKLACFVHTGENSQILTVSNKKICLTEIQKQTTLRDGISIRAIAAKVGVDKCTVLLAKQKIKPMHS
jgi:hypothetical protein